MKGKFTQLDWNGLVWKNQKEPLQFQSIFKIVMVTQSIPGLVGLIGLISPRLDWLLIPCKELIWQNIFLVRETFSFFHTVLTKLCKNMVSRNIFWSLNQVTVWYFAKFTLTSKFFREIKSRNVFYKNFFLGGCILLPKKSCIHEM